MGWDDQLVYRALMKMWVGFWTFNLQALSQGTRCGVEGCSPFLGSQGGAPRPWRPLTVHTLPEVRWREVSPRPGHVLRPEGARAFLEVQLQVVSPEGLLCSGGVGGRHTNSRGSWSQGQMVGNVLSGQTRGGDMRRGHPRPDAVSSGPKAAPDGSRPTASHPLTRSGGHRGRPHPWPQAG